MTLTPHKSFFSTVSYLHNSQIQLMHETISRSLYFRCLMYLSHYFHNNLNMEIYTALKATVRRVLTTKI